MSNKLNVEELAENRYPVPYDEPSWDDFQKQMAYAAAIREVAQPIADERDELREVLEGIMYKRDPLGFGDDETYTAARAILKKYPKP
jgi:hypothetical protein